MAGTTRTLTYLFNGLLAVLLACTAAAGADEFAEPAFPVGNMDDGVDLREISEPLDFVAAGDLVIFTAGDDARRKLWRTDGTPGGTFALGNIAPFLEPWIHRVRPVSFGDLAAFSFAGFDGDSWWRSVWRSDGTTEGTFALLVDQSASSLAAIGTRLFFLTIDRDVQTGHVLWTSDGSIEGTVPVRRFAQTRDRADFAILQAAGSRIYAIFASEYAASTKIWAADAGSLVEAGEGPQTAIPIELPLSVPYAAERASAGDILLLVATDAEGVTALWRSDGTSAGTFPLLYGAPGRDPFYRDERFRPHFTQDGQSVFFIATDGGHGLEPWVTDGTIDGTRMFADVVPGAEGVYPCATDQDWECEQRTGIAYPEVTLVPLENGLLIGRTYTNEAYSGVSDAWETDGTVDGSRRIEDAVPGIVFTSRSIAGRDRSLLFYSWQDGARALWYGDGTLAGSTRIATLSVARIVEAANGFIFAGWEPGDLVSQPWWSDGTPEGTYRLRSIRSDDVTLTPTATADDTATATVLPGGGSTPTLTASADDTATATPTPTATAQPGGDSTPTPTTTADDTAPATPTATAPCTLDGDRPGCTPIVGEEGTSSSGSCAIEPHPTGSLGPVVAALLALFVARRGRRRGIKGDVARKLVSLLVSCRDAASRAIGCTGRALPRDRARGGSAQGVPLGHGLRRLRGSAGRTG